MSDIQRMRLARIVAAGRMFGWNVTTPEAGMIAAHHERGTARLSWPLPRLNANVGGFHC